MIAYILTGLYVICFASLNAGCLFCVRKRYPVSWIFALCGIAFAYSLPSIALGFQHSILPIGVIVSWALFLLVWLLLAFAYSKLFASQYTQEKKSNPNRYANLLQTDQYAVLAKELSYDHSQDKLPMNTIDQSLFPGCAPEKIESFLLYCLAIQENSASLKQTLAKSLLKINESYRTMLRDVYGMQIDDIRND